MNLAEQTKKIQTFIKIHPQVKTLKEKDAAEFYSELIDCVVDHNHLYYVENKPIISDKEYDELFVYLKKIEEEHPEIISSNSPTQGLVGQSNYPTLKDGVAIGGFTQAKHKVKLASLENTYNAQDLRDRGERIRKILQTHPNPSLDKAGLSYRVEPKFDGLSVELIYEKGIFVQAITRGDGWVGDDITANAKTIKNIPKTLTNPPLTPPLSRRGTSLPEYLRVRGEIMMPKSVWKELNKEREEDGEIPFANTRNAAAGSVKLLDSREVARRKLVCYVYDVLESDIDLETFGLPVFPRVKMKQTIDDVVALCEDGKTKAYLESQDIDFDGLVIKVESQEQRELIGSTEHHPRRAVAYKFPAQVVATQVDSVDFQVGRTGIITPVANLKPVELSGVTIKRVSLHNFDFIKGKDIHIHDRVWLQRSGEVIPYIVSSITDRRPNDAKKILMPRVCPSCGEKVINQEIHYFCRNPHCPAQVKEKLIHWVSKQCMDIEGIGESTIDVFVDQGLLKDIVDIYHLPEKQAIINKLPGFGDKKITEMMIQIEESKKKPLWRLLNGLGISHVGKKTAMDLAKSLANKSIPNPSFVKEGGVLHLLVDEEFLQGIYGIGEKSIVAIKQFFGDKQNKKLLDVLEKFGVNFDPKKYDEMQNVQVLGTFSITGTFPVSREKIVEIMQKNGYIFHESPTKTTNFMLVGEDAGSKKAKAEQLGLKIYEGWEELVKNFSLNPPASFHSATSFSKGGPQAGKAQSLF